MKGLAAYWPTLPNIQDCIRTEAETADDAVLLAVHEPVPLRFRQAGSGEEVTRTEQDLLQALMVPESETGGSAVVVAITGASGVGKSHMVRWLHAQLQRHPSRERFVIVLIPKTASLRQVVERMLEPLRGEAYDRLRNELSVVTESLSEEKASALLGTALASELKERATEWKAELKKSGRTDDSIQRQRIFHADGLYSLLSDGVVRDEWFGDVLKRIVTQTRDGGSEAETGALRRFVPADLVLPESFNVTQAARPTQVYLQKLDSNEGEGRDIAANVLQEALDPALRTIFRFSEALGQRTIEEIVLDIRTRLLEENKELVLLIEDFAALAGIQQPLLNLMIAESDHGGQRVRAQLRTALAVTDGFLPSRQTILTRAKGEWVIPSDAPSDEDIVRRLTVMAGRYLNAARWGLAALRHQFATRNRTEGDRDLYAWVTAFSAELSVEHEDALRAFGFSPHGHPLFPFNSHAIASFCRRELTAGGRLVFNPREFINRVLRDTLLLRSEFEVGRFPDGAFKKATLATQADLDLGRQAHPGTIRGRLANVLVHWAGNPQTLSAASAPVQKDIFSTFGLPWPFVGTTTLPESVSPVRNPLSGGGSRGDEPVGPKPSTPPDPPESPSVPVNEVLAQELESWADGLSLSQKTARHLRNLLIEALKPRIDWERLGLWRMTLKADTIWIPHVRFNNPTVEPIFRVWFTELPMPAQVRAGLLALNRWGANDKRWDYPQSEDDYAAVQFLLDHLQPQIEKWALDMVDRALPEILRTLHRQSLLLGLASTANPSDVRLSEWLDKGEDAFARWMALEQQSPSAEILEFARFLNGTQTGREQLQAQLREYAGCFQGATRSNLHAVHLPRVQRAWSQRDSGRDIIRISDQYPDAREAVTTFSDSRLIRPIARLSALAKPACQTIKGAFDVDCNAAQVRKAVEKLLEEAKACSVIPDSVAYADVIQAVDDLDQDRLKPLIGRVHCFQEPSADDPINDRLTAWAALDVPTLVQTATAVSRLNEFLGAIECQCEAELCASGGADAAGQLNKLIDLLDIRARTCN